MQSISENFKQKAIAITIILASTLFLGTLGLALYFWMKYINHSKSKKQPQLTVDIEEKAAIQDPKIKSLQSDDLK